MRNVRENVRNMAPPYEGTSSIIVFQSVELGYRAGVDAVLSLDLDNSDCSIFRRHRSDDPTERPRSALGVVVTFVQEDEFAG